METQFNFYANQPRRGEDDPVSDENAEVQEAIHEFHQYLSDQLAPLLAQGAMSLLLTYPPALMASAIQSWSKGQIGVRKDAVGGGAPASAGAERRRRGPGRSAGERRFPGNRPGIAPSRTAPESFEPANELIGTARHRGIARRPERAQAARSHNRVGSDCRGLRVQRQ